MDGRKPDAPRRSALSRNLLAVGLDRGARNRSLRPYGLPACAIHRAIHAAQKRVSAACAPAVLDQLSDSDLRLDFHSSRYRSGEFAAAVAGLDSLSPAPAVQRLRG